MPIPKHKYLNTFIPLDPDDKSLLCLDDDHVDRRSFPTYLATWYPLTLNLLKILNLKLRNPQHRKLMLTLHRLNLPIPPLRLLFDPQRLRLHPYDPSPTLENPFIQIRRSFERIVATSQTRCAVQSEHIAGHDAGHMEGETHDVACGDEVGFGVNMGRDEVRGLGFEEGKELFDGVGENGWDLRLCEW